MTHGTQGLVRQTLSPLSEVDVAGGVLPRLRHVVRSRPDALAVVDADIELTFAELIGRACAVAEALQDLGSDRHPVAMLAGHDAPAIATLLGVVLSGHPLLVMDPLTPVPRLRSFVERLGAAVLVADRANADLGAEVVAAIDGRVLLSPAEAAGPDWTTSAIWRRHLDPTRTAALGFTSGSTGVPKVVAMNHQHLIGDAWAGSTATGIVGAGDVMAHTLPLGFAAGMNVALTGPLAGATLAMYDTRSRGIAGLADWIETAGVTMMAASPAILRAFVAADPTPRKLLALRSLGLSGEAAYGRDVLLARTVLPGTCSIYHRLGSTETGLIAEFRADSDTVIPEGRLPVGVPTGSSRVDLIDDEGYLVPPGEGHGRLVVTRSYLSSGYWGDPENTADAFRDNVDGTRSFRTNDLGRFDEAGNLYLLGRSDHSVKIRGYLVEPGEVDAVLFSRPDVVEAVTVGLPRPDGLTSRLVSYVVSNSDKPNAAAIRATARESLPSHMVPEVVVFLAALPRTDRGKIDRAALPPPPPPVGGEPPANEWEDVIAQVWGRALGLDDVLRDADFFELGGDSLAAESLIAMVINDLKIPAAGVTPALLVEAPTVAQFAERLHRMHERPHQTMTALREQGTKTPLFIVAGGGGLGIAFVALARHLGDDQPVYAMHAHALEQRGIPDWTVEAAARRHLVEMRRIQPCGPYYLAGHSFGGVIAFEMAHRLRRAGHEVALLVVMDSFPPDPYLVPKGPSLPALRRLKETIGLATTGLVQTPGTAQFWRFYRQSQFMSERYHSDPYPGRTLVVVAQSPEREIRSRWDPHLSGSWRLISTEGDHNGFLRDPHVADFAQTLIEALAEARQEVSSRPDPQSDQSSRSGTTNP